MPSYEWRCARCGVHRSTFASIHAALLAPACLECGGAMSRRYTPPAVVQGFQGHYNHSVGAYVADRGDFRAALEQRSEELTKRTGIEHKFAPIDAGEAPGVDREQASELQRKKELARDPDSRKVIV